MEVVSDLLSRFELALGETLKYERNSTGVHNSERKRFGTCDHVNFKVKG
jgi:hypothetical protein